MKSEQDEFIVSNQIECLHCGDKPWSASRHDFSPCKCGKVAADGGMAYLRRVGAAHKDFRDISIVMDTTAVSACEEAVREASKTGRNELGIALAVLRAVRDHGWLRNHKDK